jgi:hypothetical protein
MIPAFFLMIVVVVGCAPLMRPARDKAENEELAMETVRRKNAEDRIAVLEEENRNLTRIVKSRRPAAEISKEDLDVIKKQALEEAERNSRIKKDK